MQQKESVFIVSWNTRVGIDSTSYFREKKKHLHAFRRKCSGQLNTLKEFGGGSFAKIYKINLQSKFKLASTT